jgi:acyl-CoA thioesterase-1
MTGQTVGRKPSAPIQPQVKVQFLIQLNRLADLLAVDAALVIVELGGNDGLRGYPPSHLEHNLWQLITSFRKHGAQVILTGIRLPPNYGHRYGDAFAAVYPRVARETGARLVEFFMDGVGGHQALMQEDGLHPNDKAQPVLLDNIWPAVRDAVTDLEISKRP